MKQRPLRIYGNLTPVFTLLVLCFAPVLTGCQTPAAARAKPEARQAWNAQRGAVKYELASAEFKRGNTDDSLTLAKEAVALSPDNPAHVELLARVHIAKGDYASARQVLLTARQAHPQFAETSYLLGTIYERERQWDAAIEAYGQAVAIRPEALDYRIALAQAAAQAGKPDDALALLRDEETRFAAEPSYHLARAELHRQMGDLTQACADYERARQLGVNDPATRQSLGLCLYWLGRASEALEYLTPLVREQKTPETAVMNAFAGCLLAGGQAAQAADWLTRFTMQKPKEGPLWLLLAQARSATGDADGAVKAAQRAVALLPDAPEAHAILAAVALAAGRTDLAEQEVRQVLHGKPDDADAWVLFGRLRERRGDRPAAARAYQTALKAAPDHPLAAQLLAKIEN